jgi:hypothetical protein
MIPVPPKYKKLAQRVEERRARLNPPPPMPPVQRVIVEHNEIITNDTTGIPGRLALIRRVIMPQPTTVPEPEPEPPRGVEPRAPGTSNIGSGYR